METNYVCYSVVRAVTAPQCEKRKEKADYHTSANSNNVILNASAEQEAQNNNHSDYEWDEEQDCLHVGVRTPNAKAQPHGTKTLRPRQRICQRHPVLAAAIC